MPRPPPVATSRGPLVVGKGSSQGGLSEAAPTPDNYRAALRKRYGTRADAVLRADSAAPLAPGAAHSAEMEYALGNPTTNEVRSWQKADYQVSKTWEGYCTNFIRSGNPNGAGLPGWTALNRGTGGQWMLLDALTHAGPLPDQAR